MLNNETLVNVKGGAINFNVLAIVAAAASFIAGFLDGLARPFSCR